ncbi:MAG TPA: SDR family oxidoreductase [Polyangiaceae bacterium]|jgi:NAD(P)-dependent dehydrogenase (short-subunit alcohol dehydrogenase family)|nr:SDR family oxidoreductase [Polyangiaceae bacterium]
MNEPRTSSGPSRSLGDLFSVRGKVALVTGGSSGIGTMIARGYLEAGARVYISSRKADACNAAVAELGPLGECIAIPADVATTEGREALVAELQRREKALHILVNNAGTAWGAPLGEYPEGGFRKVMALNTEAVFFLTQSLLPLLGAAATADDPARVINIGSIDGIRVPELDTFAYSASKAAVHHMTRVLAVKLGPKHITVNAVAPGPFESKMTAWVLENQRAALVGHCPLGRIGVDADMAGIAVFLASRAAAYITGAVIPVDGGITCA